MKREDEKTVSSKFELTPNLKKGRKKQGKSLRLYHADVKRSGKEIADFALKKFPTNLLSAKMATMEAVRLIEARLREGRE